MDIDKLVAIDIHTHAEVSCCQAHDPYAEEFDRAADKIGRASCRERV